MNIQQWLESNRLNGRIEDSLLFIDETKFLLIERKEPLFDEEFNLTLNEEEYDLAGTVDYIAFKFGDSFYYTDRLTKPNLKPLIHIGKPDIQFKYNLPVIGIHGGYDLCNGSRIYDDWCKEAKWLGISTLGICEEGTLAGVVAFQNACQKHNINSIIGETIVIQDSVGERYSIKLYCKDKITWSSLIYINTQLSKNKFLPEKDIHQLLEDTDLICVLSPDISINSKYQLYSKIQGICLYYDLDFTEWDSQSRDSIWLDNLQEYLKSYTEIILPVLRN